MDGQKLLEYWKENLCLQDWRIKLVDGLAPEEMTIDGVAGCTDWTEAVKAARIEILDPSYYGERIVPFDYEKTLVHELLHLKFCFWSTGENVEVRVMHQNIDDIARALVAARRENDKT